MRAGYLVWSLTWRDLEVALGKGGDALNVLGDDDGRMAKLQRTLDERWDTALIRSRLGEPSLMLLVRYLRNPDRVAWKRAVFTHLLGLFDPRDLRSAELAWEAERGAVLLAEQNRPPFDVAGWRTFPADTPELAETISTWWTEVRT